MNKSTIIYDGAGKNDERIRRCICRHFLHINQLINHYRPVDWLFLSGRSLIWQGYYGDHIHTVYFG